MDSLEVNRQSLLEGILDRNNKISKPPQMTTRICYVANFAEVSAEDLAAWHERMVKMAPKEATDSSGVITGLLLLFSNTLIHVLETSGKVMTSVLKELETKQRIDPGWMPTIKIIASVEDVTRCVPTWAYRKMSTSSGGLLELDSGERKMAEEVASVYINMLKIGLSMFGVKKIDMAAFLDDLKAKCGDLLPTHDKLMQLVENEDVPSLQEYLEIFNSPLEPTFDSEVVWPMEQRLVY